VLAALLSRHALKSVDGRSKGDPLYMYADDSNPELSKQRWWTRERGNF
jgi:hypothetical protein